LTKDESKILDWRSTGRRKARRTLYAAYVPYACVHCGKTSEEPPKDAPAWFDEIWPEENRVLDYPLQADHETKDYQNNEVENINWKCSPCHKKDDGKTAKGEPQTTKNYW
jgi:hypothetical protein